MQMMLQFRVVI